MSAVKLAPSLLPPPSLLPSPPSIAPIPCLILSTACPTLVEVMLFCQHFPPLGGRPQLVPAGGPACHAAFALMPHRRGLAWCRLLGMRPVGGARERLLPPGPASQSRLAQHRVSWCREQGACLSQQGSSSEQAVGSSLASAAPVSGHQRAFPPACLPEAALLRMVSPTLLCGAASASWPEICSPRSLCCLPQALVSAPACTARAERVSPLVCGFQTQALGCLLSSSSGRSGQRLGRGSVSPAERVFPGKEGLGAESQPHVPTGVSLVPSRRCGRVGGCQASAPHLGDDSRRGGRPASGNALLGGMPRIYSAQLAGSPSRAFVTLRLARLGLGEWLPFPPPPEPPCHLLHCCCSRTRRTRSGPERPASTESRAPARELC